MPEVGFDTAVQRVEQILKEEIDLAKPDDLAYLEFQLPRIARDIVQALLDPPTPAPTAEAG